MKALFIIPAAFALLLGGCAGALSGAEATLRLQAADLPLRLAAQQSLHLSGMRISNEDGALPLLQLEEDYSYAVDSLAADGSVGGYQITYTLTYRLGDADAQSIARQQVVSHSENRYLAGANQRREMVDSLRRSALAQMITALQLAGTR